MNETGHVTQTLSLISCVVVLLAACGCRCCPKPTPPDNPATNGVPSTNVVQKTHVAPLLGDEDKCEWIASDRDTDKRWEASHTFRVDLGRKFKPNQVKKAIVVVDTDGLLWNSNACKDGHPQFCKDFAKLDNSAEWELGDTVVDHYLTKCAQTDPGEFKQFGAESPQALRSFEDGEVTITVVPSDGNSYIVNFIAVTVFYDE